MPLQHRLLPQVHFSAPGCDSWCFAGTCWPASLSAAPCAVVSVHSLDMLFCSVCVCVFAAEVTAVCAGGYSYSRRHLLQRRVLLVAL